MSDLTRKTLMDWVILSLLVNREEVEKNTIFLELPTFKGFFSAARKNQKPIINHLIHLEEDNMIVNQHLYNRSRFGIYRITGKGRDWFINMKSAWIATLEQNLSTLLSIKHYIQKRLPNNLGVQSNNDYQLFNQILDNKIVIPFLISEVLQHSNQPLSLSEIEKNILSNYAISCTSTTYKRYLDDLVHTGVVNLLIKEETCKGSGKSITYDSVVGDQQHTIDIENVIQEVTTAQDKLGEIKAYIEDN